MEGNVFTNLLLNDKKKNRKGNSKLPAQYLLPEELLFPNKSQIPDWKILKEFFKIEGKLQLKHANQIVQMASKIFSNEKNIIHVEEPLVAVGDLHGQYYDLCTILEKYGTPETLKYVFLGDYVDRGMFAVETILLLYCLKINYPQNVMIIRGNHECRNLSEHFNFKKECISKYGEEFHEAIQDSFDALPLACLINKRMLGIHGGISEKFHKLQDIEKLNRFDEPPQSGLFCDILWSDPVENSEGICDPNFRFNTTRSCACYFGLVAISEFLKKNNLISIIRGHEVQDEGFKLHSWGQQFPPVITIFSAANYCDVYKNKGAVIKFSNNSMDIYQYNQTPHPFVLPNFMDAFSFSIPYIHTRVSEMMQKILNIQINEKDKASGFSKEEAQNYDSLILKLENSSRSTDVLLSKELIKRITEAFKREKDCFQISKGMLLQNMIPKEFINDKTKDKITDQELFSQARKYDLANNERNPYSGKK